VSTTNDEQAAARDVRISLHELHFSTSGFDDLLEEITVLAADTLSADCSAGVTVIRAGKPTTVAASDERTLELDEIQYGNGDGPCLHAARAGEVVTMADVAHDPRWPGYSARGSERGLRSSMAIPLTLGEPAIGALNMYVFDEHQIDDVEQTLLDQFGDETSRAVSLALRYDGVSTENAHLHTAMGTRRVIDQAIGLVMAQNRCSAAEAFDVLRRASQNRNVKINQLAAAMIRQVTGADHSAETHWQG
jgi:GAF domain-containing protein